MDILHITDLHFGPYHWLADDQELLDRLNVFEADLGFNTGDSTSDSLPDEFAAVQAFLSGLQCPNVVSIMGNHDKYAKRSQELFRQYLYGGPFLEPKDPSKVTKPKVYHDPQKMNLSEYMADVNFVRQFTIGQEEVLILCLDTNKFQSDFGLVEEQFLYAMADEMARRTYDRAIMLAHHPIVVTDPDPLIDSKRVADFVLDNQIEAVFCGHTHEVDMVEVSDLVRKAKFRQFMTGSLSSANVYRDKNMFTTIKNFGTAEENITITRIEVTPEGLTYSDTVVS